MWPKTGGSVWLRLYFFSLMLLLLVACSTSTQVPALGNDRTVTGFIPNTLTTFPVGSACMPSPFTVGCIKYRISRGIGNIRRA